MFRYFQYFGKIFQTLSSLLLYILAFATFVQVFYALFFYARILFYKKAVTNPANSPTVSVIVCAHNELKNLQKLVPAILAQEYENFEFILADDRSEDGTIEYFSSLAQKDIRFKIVRITETIKGRNFKKNALTTAIQAASNEVLLLTDADCRPVSSRWIGEMIAALGEEKDIVLGYSPYEYRKGLLNLLIRYETLYTAVQYFSLALSKMPYMGVGRNLLYKKSVFIQNKGFSNHINTTGGDDDLFIREVANGKNTTISFTKNSQMLSLPKEDYFSWLKQKRRHLSVGTLYNWRHKTVLGIQMLSHILFYISLAGVFYQEYKAAFLFLMIRGLVFVVIFTLIARKLGDNYRWWAWLLLPIDMIYIFNYLIITLSLLIYKKIKWS